MKNHVYKKVCALKHHIYIKICIILFISLLEFSLLSNFLDWKLSEEEYKDQILNNTTALATILLPPVNASKNEQLQAVQKVSKAMGFDISLFAADKELIAASGDVSYPSSVDIKQGMWVPEARETRWVTILPDGRWVAIKLDNMGMLIENERHILAFAVILILIFITTYPFIRRLTGRLERLQQSVESIGNGDLSARVKVEGKDEVALLAQSFNNTAEKIEKLVVAQRLLLANASHELRTPLSRIRLGIDMLEKENSLARRDALRSDIRELDMLIHELLLMSRLDSGVEEEMEEVDMMAMVAEECSRYPDCNLVGNVTSTIRGNLRMLQHMVRNLIDNAYTHGKAPVEVQLKQDNGYLKLIVSDGGDGISESEWANVFEPFYRAKDKQNVQGFGLGLPIIKKIAEAHNATIIIKNDPISMVIVMFFVNALDEKS